MGNKLHMIKKFLFFLIISFALTSCNAFKPKKVNTRDTPVNVMDRAKKNVLNLVLQIQCGVPL